MQFRPTSFMDLSKTRHQQEKTNQPTWKINSPEAQGWKNETKSVDELFFLMHHKHTRNYPNSDLRLLH